MSLEGLLTMSTKELKRISIIEKVVDKKLTQMNAAQHLGITVRQIKRLEAIRKIGGIARSRSLLPIPGAQCLLPTLGEGVLTEQLRIVYEMSF